MKKILLSFILSIIFVVSGCHYAYSDDYSQDKVNIIEKSLKFTGFDKLKNYSKSSIDVSLIEINGEKTDNLDNYNNKKNVWLIKYKDVTFKDSSNYFHPKELNTKSFEVLIENKTNKLISIISITDSAYYAFQDTLFEMKDNFIRDSKMSFHGFVPDTINIVNFTDALFVCRHNPFLAKAIEARCLLFTYESEFPHLSYKTPHPFWWIKYYGIKVASKLAHRSDSEGKYVTNETQLVDAITGELLFGYRGW